MPTPKKNKKRKLPNARQQALVKNLAKGMTQKNAALAAGYSANSPRQAAHQALEQIAKTWPEFLEQKVGTPEQVIDKYLLPLMNATETKVFNNNGNIIYAKPMKAWGPRRDGLDIFCRIVGAYQERSGEQNTGPVQVIINTNVNIPDPGMILPEKTVKAIPADTNGHASSNGHKPDKD